ncbi:MAG TPA: CHRD domain-containing protein [Nitrososphaera sp.]|nr:CHRD domain-containing protein [Nitrososphaera sp.]
MQPRILSPILLGLVLLFGLTVSTNTSPAYAAAFTCSASPLDGSQEVPPVITDGTGSAVITFDSTSNRLSWSILFSGLFGPATAAHFHGPALAGANAGVQVNIGELSGLTSPMNGSAILTPEQASSLLEGSMYINIHSESNTGGEIRGQVSCEQTDEGWLDSFNLEDCELASLGTNDYFYLEPGYNLTLEGQEDEENIQLIVTVLNETKIVNGIETRIVEERESEDGELIEISRNYFAICTETNDIFYFGEGVDIYEGGEVVGHEGAWIAGEDDARPGMIIPAKPTVGLKYYQEVAPGVAEDRAEIISLNEVVDTPAGHFEDVLKVEETNLLESGEKEYKFHALGIGLIQDAQLKLVEYVLPEVEEPDELEVKSMVQSVVVSGNTIQVNLNSSSTISEFELDEESKRLSFRADGEAGSEGRTDISIGRILEGPYTVTIDGQATADFNVTNAASGEAMISISYTHSVHDITITGTNVIPEFPVAVVGAVAGIIGVAALLARSKFMNGFINGQQ